MTGSPLALRMMAAKFAQLARAAMDAREAERLMAQSRCYQRLAVKADRAERQRVEPAEKERAKTESRS